MGQTVTVSIIILNLVVVPHLNMNHGRSIVMMKSCTMVEPTRLANNVQVLMSKSSMTLCSNQSTNSPDAMLCRETGLTHDLDKHMAGIAQFLEVAQDQISHLRRQSINLMTTTLLTQRSHLVMTP